MTKNPRVGRAKANCTLTEKWYACVLLTEQRPCSNRELQKISLLNLKFTESLCVVVFILRLSI